jgi:NAD(P)-dependent dehydrogenase (short-subunit alcohol dehydrogenase family)
MEDDMSTPPATASPQASARVEIVVWGITLDDAPSVRQAVDAWDADVGIVDKVLHCTAFGDPDPSDHGDLPRHPAVARWMQVELMTEPTVVELGDLLATLAPFSPARPPEVKIRDLQEVSA